MEFTPHTHSIKFSSVKKCGFLSTHFLVGVPSERSKHTVVRVIIIGGVSLIDG